MSSLEETKALCPSGIEMAAIQSAPPDAIHEVEAQTEVPGLRRDTVESTRIEPFLGENRVILD